ncbi:N-acetyltransferase family protein [Falsiroseomonas sp. HC035]|uniref:GNAT family N-acetyltransferase n=1 Tax=Falsiroseomonas sp. HC035 TaxID=3390999 RepID=UPI003D3144B8
MTSRYGLEIRAATASDAPGLATLLATAGHVTDARVLAELIVASRQASSTALVALQWGPLSGLVVMHWYPTLRAPRPTAQITTLLVNAEERRQGIARILVKTAAQAARVAGCGDLEILARPDAASLDAFCRATGFAEAGRMFVRSLRKQG